MVARSFITPYREGFGFGTVLIWIPLYLLSYLRGGLAIVGFLNHGRGHRLMEAHLALCFGVAFALFLGPEALGAEADGRVARPPTERPMVLTQLPAGTDLPKQDPVAGGMLRASYGDGARLVLVSPNGSPRVLTAALASACDPEVSFDGARILFAGKLTAADPWNVFEMGVDGSGLRQITKGVGNCRSPSYQSTLYTLPPRTVVSPRPVYRITFVGDRAGTMNEFGATPATDLYCAKLDGSGVERLTFNLSSDMDPLVMPDGRLLYAGWQRARLDHGLLGRVALFGVNIDGTDHALFAGHEGRRIKHMPCVTMGGLAVFVEADRVPWDGAGRLASVRLRRPLDSYHEITAESDGLFHTPSPLPDGRILVSRRPRDRSGTHGVWRLDPSSGDAEPVFDDPRYHDVQAKCIYSREDPDGRSSVVDEADPHGKLYCLNVYTSDLEEPSWMPPGSAKRLRVLEGVPRKAGASRGGVTSGGIPSVVPRRLLGEAPVEADGSFNVEIPANTPIELQLVDADGLALRSCGWIWARNHEPRGCVGCHEDGELVPENRFVDAATRPSARLELPPGRKGTVDFRRDVMPIIAARCVPCHRKADMPLVLDGDPQSYGNLLALREPRGEGGAAGKYVHPGSARTSPVVWRVFGRNTSRPWDGEIPAGRVKRMPPDEAQPLDDERSEVRNGDTHMTAGRAQTEMLSKNRNWIIEVLDQSKRYDEIEALRGSKIAKVTLMDQCRDSRGFEPATRHFDTVWRIVDADGLALRSCGWIWARNHEPRGCVGCVAVSFKQFWRTF
jgi:hypothetical protein